MQEGPGRQGSHQPESALEPYGSSLLEDLACRRFILRSNLQRYAARERELRILPTRVVRSDLCVNAGCSEGTLRKVRFHVAGVDTDGYEIHGTKCTHAPGNVTRAPGGSPWRARCSSVRHGSSA